VKDLIYILAILALFSLHCHQAVRLDFLHAWNVVKRIRMDALARQICEEECKKLH
jgi:hypothetical protein